MRKSFNLIWMVFGFLLLIVGCNEDKKSTAFDPNQPVKFTEFMPDSGGIRTKFIVKGSNFGEDKSQVKVYFKDEVGNEREALVLGNNKCGYWAFQVRKLSSHQDIFFQQIRNFNKK